MLTLPAPSSVPHRPGRHRAAPRRTLTRRLGVGGLAVLASSVGGLGATHAAQPAATAVVTRPTGVQPPSAPLRGRLADRAASRDLARVAVSRRVPSLLPVSYGPQPPASIAAAAPSTSATAAASAAEARRRARAWSLPVSGYRLTSRFGPRWGGFHHGLDFACRVGTPLRSVGQGRVTQVRTGHRVYGTYVDIRHTDGTLTRYAHLSRVHVRVGSRLQAGQVFARTGNTGRSTGPHLHLEFHRTGSPLLSDAVDPYRELARRGVRP